MCRSSFSLHRFGTYSTAAALNAGLDLEMPGKARLRGHLADLAVSSRKVTRATIDARVRNVLNFVKRASKIVVSEEETGRDLPEDRALNRKLAADSVVLLKNSAGTLPLKKDRFKSIALIGPNMKTAAFCGGGSAALEPYYTISPYEGIVENLTEDVKIRYELGAVSSRYFPTLAGSQITMPNGEEGCQITYYADPPTVADRKAVHESSFPEMNFQLMGTIHPDLEALFYADVEASFVAPKTANFEFGLTVYGTANLYIDDKLVIDNTNKQRGGVFFMAKGTVEEKAIIPLVQGQSYKLKMEWASAPSCKLIKPGIVDFGGGGGRLGCRPALDEDELIGKAVEAAKEADVTVLCVGLTVNFSPTGSLRQKLDIV